MNRQALKPPACGRCGRFGRCVTCTGRADTASVNSKLARAGRDRGYDKGCVDEFWRTVPRFNLERARLPPSSFGCAGEPVTWIPRCPSLGNLRQDRALARVLRIVTTGSRARLGSDDAAGADSSRSRSWKSGAADRTRIVGCAPLLLARAPWRSGRPGSGARPAMIAQPDPPSTSTRGAALEGRPANAVRSADDTLPGSIAAMASSTVSTERRGRAGYILYCRD